MLNQLEDIATTLGMGFGFGDMTALEARTKDLTHPGEYLLFHEGYFMADLNQDGQGALEYRHRLILNICAKSYPTDLADQRRSYLLGLEIEMRRVYAQLRKVGQILNARAVYGLNVTSTNVDFIQLTVTLLPDAVSLCNL